jgi:hypothetical protein
MFINGQWYSVAENGLRIGYATSLAAWLWLQLYLVPRWRQREQRRRDLRRLANLDNYGQPTVR